MLPVSIAYTLAPGAHAPTRATPGAAGLDLCAYFPDRGRVHLPPGHWTRILTGVSLALPAGYEGQIRSRSGLAYAHGLTVLNSPGTIDSDFRGEVRVLVINHGQDDVTINHGDRIAQLVVCPVADAVLCPADALPPTERGAGGFGSTGTGPAPATIVPYPSGVWEYDYRSNGYVFTGPPDEAIREMVARIRHLEAAVAEARAEAAQWAAELDALRGVAQSLHDDLYDVLDAFGIERFVGLVGVRDAHLTTERIYALRDALAAARKAHGLVSR